jgi:hypothetical protein
MKSQARSGSRTSTFTALNAAIWTFFSFTFMFQLNTYFHSDLSFRITFIIVGITIGIFSSILITRRQLKTLYTKGEDPTTLKNIFITIGAVIVFIVAFLEIANSNLPKVVESAMGYSIVACTPAVFLTRTILMVYWEKQKKTIIFQDKYGIYVLPNYTNNSFWNKNAPSQTFQADSKAM